MYSLVKWPSLTPNKAAKAQVIENGARSDRRETDHKGDLAHMLFLLQDYSFDEASLQP